MQIVCTALASARLTAHLEAQLSAQLQRLTEGVRNERVLLRPFVPHASETVVVGSARGSVGGCAAAALSVGCAALRGDGRSE